MVLSAVLATCRPSPALLSLLGKRLYHAARRGTLLDQPAVAWVLVGQALSRLSHDRNLGAARVRAVRRDVLRAATADLYDAKVLTGNTRDFAAIAEVIPVWWEDGVG